MFICFFSSRGRHTRWPRDWSSDVCSSDLCLIVFEISLGNPALDLLAFDDEAAFNLWVWLNREVSETSSGLLRNRLRSDDGVLFIDLDAWLRLTVLSHHLQKLVLQRF